MLTAAERCQTLWGGSLIGFPVLQELQLWFRTKIQALLYWLSGLRHPLSNDILFPITAIIDYAIGLEKLSANGRFLVLAQMTISL